jgi:predicted metalloprotease
LLVGAVVAGAVFIVSLWISVSPLAAVAGGVLVVAVVVQIKVMSESVVQQRKTDHALGSLESSTLEQREQSQSDRLAIEAQIRELSAQLDETMGTIDTAVGRIRAVERSVRDHEMFIDTVVGRIRGVERSVRDHETFNVAIMDQLRRLEERQRATAGQIAEVLHLLAKLQRLRNDSVDAHDELTLENVTRRVRRALLGTDG